MLLVVSSTFAAMARLQVAIAGAGLPMIVLTHPVGGLTPEQLAPRVDEGVEQAFVLKADPATPSANVAAGSHTPGTPEVSVRYADLSDWLDSEEAAAWGDGLPLVPPVTATVDRFVAGLSDAARAMTFAPLAPAYRIPTVATIAANAVMAGCRPDDLPVVLAAVRAVEQDRFNLRSVIPTTHPCTPAIVVSGPIRDRLGVNYAGNCLGQGNRANATIGRALQLVLRNIAGAVPGITDQATHGSPGKYTYCFAENESASPWASMSVRRGFGPADSVVTVFAAEPPHNMSEHGATSPAELIVGLANTISESGSNNIVSGGSHLVVLCPEHAAMLAAGGMTVDDVRGALYEASKVAAGRLSSGTRIALEQRDRFPVDGYYHVGGSAAELEVVVAGGAGRHSCWIPTLARSSPTSVAVLT